MTYTDSVVVEIVVVDRLLDPRVILFGFTIFFVIERLIRIDMHVLLRLVGSMIVWFCRFG